MNGSPATLYPHLLLGVRLGADKNEATTAMALATRRLRKMADCSISTSDLTTALAKLDGTTSSDKDLMFQWPADPRTIPVRFNMNFGGRAFTSAASLIEAFESSGAPALTAQDSNSLGIAYLSEAFDAVNKWEWQNGIELAKKAHECSANERIQDEALNVIAAAHLMSGRKSLAIASLKKAIDGEWNVGLHQNLAVLTMIDNPAAAVENLSFVIASSRNPDQRVKAVQVALAAWSAANKDLDQEDLEVPPALRDALRELVVGRLSIEQFRTIARYLADNDEAWVIANRFNGSMHAGSLEAQLLIAKAEDLAEYCRLLGVNSGPTSPPWIVDEANEIAEQLVQLLLSSDMKNHIPILAMKMADGGLNNSSQRRIELKGALALRLDDVIDEDAEPAEKFIVWLDGARRALPVIDMPTPDRDRISRLLAAGAETYTRLLIRYRAKIYDEFVDVVNDMARTRDRHAAATIFNWSVDTLRILPFCRPQVAENSIVEMIDEFSGLVLELKNFVQKYT